MNRIGAVIVATAILVLTSIGTAALMPDVFRIEPRSKRSAPPAALFSHSDHSARHCLRCHPSIFPQERTGFTHAEMKEGRFCGACHNGENAWAVDAVPCSRCHEEGSE